MFTMQLQYTIQLQYNIHITYYIICNTIYNKLQYNFKMFMFTNIFFR